MLKTYFYTVVEKQILSDGSAAQIATHHATLGEAYTRLYQTLAAAAVSNLPYHAAFMFDDECVKVDGRAFDRREEVVE